MSRKENIIFELHTKKGTWKIVVRINDMWHVNKHNGRKAIEMVFMDQMGAKIGATFSRELFVEFESRLHCGSAYVIQNIKVVENHSEYKIKEVFLNPNIASIPNKVLGASSCIMLKWFHLPFVPQPSHLHGSKSGDEVKVFPPCVDELLRKTWALRFKYSVQIRQSFVLDVTEDEDIIHTIRSTISLQDEPSIEKGKDVVAETSSLDFHPTLVFFITNFHAESS
ncbi:hypothetical protein JHK87_055031 [Glycine soja]|nr:hypothetical protein JHK87_055031 [Glycine soja]